MDSQAQAQKIAAFYTAVNHLQTVLNLDESQAIYTVLLLTHLNQSLAQTDYGDYPLEHELRGLHRMLSAGLTPLVSTPV